MLYPLSDLRDPFAVLHGARVPLRATSGRQTEWVVDDAFYRINDSFEREFLRHWLDEDEERPTGIDEERARSLSLDLSDPDVARWVDRKIADHVNAGPVVAASIERVDGIFSLCYMGRNGQYTEFPLRPANNLECLRGITTTEANIPTARAALLRTLFGKAPA